MREILFKAKTIDGNEWVYGDLLQELGKCKIVLKKLSNVDGLLKSTIDEITEVIPETVCQLVIYNYHDKLNENDFYEGDIFENEYTISYNKQEASFYLKSKHGKEYDKKISAIYDERIRLTGNIHD